MSTGLILNTIVHFRFLFSEYVDILLMCLSARSTLTLPLVHKNGAVFPWRSTAPFHVIFTSICGIDWRCILHFCDTWAAFRSTLGEAGLESRVSLWSETDVNPGQYCLWRTNSHRLYWLDHGDRDIPSWPGNLALGRRIRR